MFLLFKKKKKSEIYKIEYWIKRWGEPQFFLAGRSSAVNGQRVGAGRGAKRIKQDWGEKKKKEKKQEMDGL